MKKNASIFLCRQTFPPSENTLKSHNLVQEKVEVWERFEIREILEVLVRHELLERLKILLEWVEVPLEWVAMTKMEMNSR